MKRRPTKDILSKSCKINHENLCFLYMQFYFHYKIVGLRLVISGRTVKQLTFMMEILPDFQ